MGESIPSTDVLYETLKKDHLKVHPTLANEKCLGCSILNHVEGEPMRMHNPSTCTECECMVCSVLLCPYHEPLHFHHDECPSCYTSS